MENTGQSLENIISAMKRPLQFAAKNDYASLHTVKGLDELMPALAQKALQLAATDGMKTILTAVGNSFTEFYTLDQSRQQQAVQQALDLLDRIRETEPPPAPDMSGDSFAASLAAPAARHTDALILLSTPVTTIKGVGPRTAEALMRQDISTVEDVLYHAPRCYIDRRRIFKINELSAGQHATVTGTVMTARIGQLGGRTRFFDLLVTDGSGVVSAKWFNVNMPFAQALKKKYGEGSRVLLAGQTTQFKFRIEMHHPEIETVDEDDDPAARLSIVPVYPLTEGVSQKIIRKITRQVVDQYAARLPDYRPPALRRQYKLIDLQAAFAGMHYPDNSADCDGLASFNSPFHRRIIFDELFLLQAMLALRRRGTALECGTSFQLPKDRLENVLAALPFSLTSAQQKTLRDILADMQRPSPMNRLVQGDVGSGKTVVALLAAMIAHWNGFQAALMAPTEILAGQHFKTIQMLTEGHDLKIALLTGSMPKAAREEILAAIRDGRTALIIGTHALIQEAVEFHRLGLAVIDEQHRFGVLQRGLIKKKGDNPDVLVMTATPIPRTLGLTVYGDLDISIIDELPPGRKPVVTKVYHENKRDEVYRLVRKYLEKGNQAFIVYPLVDESEKSDLKDATTMTAHLQQDIFPDYRVGLIHGRMAQQDKDSIMGEFKAGEIHMLVATTVIEVGIDVPNASLMVIEHAERFGLSQLHQLRGRVGRGTAESHCILLAQYNKSDSARQRLAIMEKTNDGFKIAEEDFNIRGPGEFLGTRQSGLTDFRVANIARDIQILIDARKAAFSLIAEDPELKKPEHQLIRLILAERSRGRFELAGIG